MANQEHLDRLRQGMKRWNAWKRLETVPVDLAVADLQELNLIGADLRNTRLEFAQLMHANLTNADLSGATLSGANLTRTRTIHTRFHRAHLSETIFADVDLSKTSGLSECVHDGPSIIDYRTLLKSGSLPLHFLRGCGLPDLLIDYLPSLINTGPIQFFSCFISYSTANQGFATRLHADLQDNGVRCWFASHDMQPGKKIHDQIDEAIRVYDRLLLILSTESMSSTWVKTEIAKARKKEVTLQRRVLFPLGLAPFNEIREWEQFDADIGDDSAKEIREYFILDFSDWKNHDAYQRSFERLLASLTSAG